MDTVTVIVTYGSGSVTIPEDAVQTEITPYMWPGHYGEWDAGQQTFTAWALVNSSEWRVTSELRAPPATCLAVGATVSRWRFVQGPQEWFVEPRPLLLLQICPELLQGQSSRQSSKKDLDVQLPGPVQVQVHVPVSPIKEQSAVWRIHTCKT